MKKNLEKEYDYKVSAAGRANIIGEHVDYCGGKVLPVALSLKNAVYVKANGTNKINIEWTTIDAKVSLDIDELENYANLKYGNYQAGCTYVWKNAGHKLTGCDMVQDCSVPFGSGLSSSAAIEVSTLAAFAVLSGEKIDKKEIALLAQKAEREYVGVNCGIMDQYASANGVKNGAMFLDCKKVEHQTIPFDLGDYALVIANCNKPHNLVESKYNERREETEKALDILKTAIDVECLADVSVDDFEKNKSLLSGKIRDRAEHVVYECDRTLRAVEALRNGDLKTLGDLLNQSHESLRVKYEVTGKELDVLSDASRSFDGCLGSRMTGAGFGGCVISIVKKDVVDDFKASVGKKYRDEIGYDCSFYEADISDGIIIEKL